MHQKQEDSDPIPVKIFYFYSDEEDKQERAAKQRLDRHLDTLKRITGVHLINSRVDPGQVWKEIIDENLNKADIIILLISPDFMHDDCFEKAQIALAMHHQEKTLVVPVHFRSTTMTDESFSALQMLPANKIPVKSWTHIDDACAEVVEGIKLAIKAIRLKRKALLTIADADRLFFQQSYEQALSSYQSAQSSLEQTSFKKSLSHVLWHIGNTHYKLRHYEEALEAYKKAIAIDPQPEFYKEKSDVLLDLGRDREVIETCDAAIPLIEAGNEQTIVAQIHVDTCNAAITLRDVVAQIYLNKGIALAKSSDLKNEQALRDALVAFDNALTSDDKNIRGLWWKGRIHTILGDGEEAKNSYRKATEVQENNAGLRKAYGDVLFRFQDFAEAQEQYNRAIKIDEHFALAYQKRAQTRRELAAKLLQDAKEDEKQFQQLTGQSQQLNN